MPARDRNGRLVAGAKLRVLVNRTSSTNAPIFTASDLVTPLANPVVANSSGQFPAIWVDDADLYTVSITGPNGESIGNPSVFDDYASSEILSIVDEVAAAVTAPAIALIVAAGDAEVLAIGEEGTEQIGLVTTAGSTQVSAVETEGSEQVGLVEAAGTAQVAVVAAAAGAEYYADAAAGISGTSDGEFFLVVEDGRAVVYKNVSGVATEQTTYPTNDDVEGLAPLFVGVTSDNLFDPATGVDNAGVNSSGSVFSLARYGRLFIPVTAGQPYTISCAYAPTNWDLDQTAWVNFYNSASFGTGTLVDNSTASPQENDVVFSESGRTVSFTAPTGATYACVNAYNLTTATPDAAAYDALWAGVMANEGVGKAAFQAFVPAGTKDFPATVKNPTGRVRALLTGTSLYVWQPMWNDPTRASVRLISYGDTPSTSEAGTVDMIAHRFVDASYDQDLIELAYNAGESVWASIDNGPPFKFNGQYLGGGHGLAGAYNVTITGHGLTNTDVGDVGTISAKSWVLVRVVDANTITIVAANTGASETLWTITGSPAPGASGTITFASAGAKSYTASAATQIWPLVQNYTLSAKMEGETDLVDGTPANGSYFELRESYGIPNPANWLATLISEKGTATPKALNDPAITTQLYVDQVWRFDRFGAMTGYGTYRAGQEFEIRSTDYFGAWQHQTLIKTSHTLWQYMAGVASAIGGYDFTATADITSNSAERALLTSNVSDAAKPSAVFAQFLKLSGNPVLGLAHGYMTTTGVGKPAERADNTYLFRLSSSEKMYPVAIDGGAFPSGLVPAGTVMQVGFWDQCYDMSDTPTRTVDAVYEHAGKVYRVVDIHDTITYGSLDVPAELVGKPVEVVESQGGFTLHSDEFVPAGGLTYSVSGGYGRAIIAIG